VSILDNMSSESKNPINLDLSHLTNIELDEETNVNAYGYEDLSYITSEDMDTILDAVKSYDDACATPGALIKLMHFNVNHPENRNLIMNDKGDTCVFDGKNWKQIDKDTFHNLVVDRAFNIITNYYIRRRELYKLKNNLLRLQSELVKNFEMFKDEILEKFKIIANTSIEVTPLLCPNYPRKRTTQNITHDILNDNKYKKSIIDLYGNDNLNKYFSFKTRVLSIEVELNEDTLTKDDKDNLNLELIDINDKILEFEQSEKMMLEENA